MSISRRKSRAARTVAHIMGALAVAIPIYIIWPVETVTLPTKEPIPVDSSTVPDDGQLTWLRPGQQCWPDEDVLVRWIVNVTRPNGYEFGYPGVGPLVNMHGGCSKDPVIHFELPTNVTRVPGSTLVVRFDFCSNPGQLLRERCVSTHSPTYTMPDQQ